MSDGVLFIHVNLLAPLDSPDTIPISEATILAYLQHHGFTGALLGDYADAPLTPAVLMQAIRKEKPLVVGFTTYQENIRQVRLWARYIKKMVPSTKIILGGPQATFMPGQALLHMPEVDFLCRGEGEPVMLSLAETLRDGGDAAQVSGLSLVHHGQVRETGPMEGVADLDTYPSPYLANLVDLRRKERIILLTSRGCPYSCAFCYTPKASKRKVRFFSLERIIEEMKYLKSRGISAFWFADTNFSYSRERLVSLAEAMIKHVPGISFWCQTRYDLITQETLALLKRAGAENIAYGLESANPSVLERIQKPIDLHRLSSVIRMTQEAGIHVELFSMFALPGETTTQALRTLAYVQNNGVAVDGNSISQQAHLFFGTPLNDDPDGFGIRPLRRTRPAYLSVCRDYETDAMSAGEIRKISLIWRLNRQDFEQDVTAEENLFHRAGFIVENRSAFFDRPEAYVLLARIYLALEEYGAAVRCMEALEKRFAREEMVYRFIKKPVRCFKTTSEPASFGDRVIYHCQGSEDGRIRPETIGRYQAATLGEGSLLRAFEAHLLKKAAGDNLQFDMAFPENYGQRALAGRTVSFQVQILFVFKPVTVSNYRVLDGDSLRNDYPLMETEILRQVNINLYYKTMRRALHRGFFPSLPDALMLTNLLLKLGFVDQAEQLVGKLPQNALVFGQLAHLFRLNAQPARAIEYLDRADTEKIRLDKTSTQGQRQQLIRAQALFDLERFEEAENVVGAIGYGNDISSQELRVQLAERLSLPHQAYLEREADLLDMKTSLMGR